jgi:PAS domain S-box-containing protein
MPTNQAVQAINIALCDTNIGRPDLINQSLIHFGYTPRFLPIKDLASLELALAGAPDIILAGINPGVLDACQILAILRERNLDIPLFVLISDEQTSMIWECLEKGAADCFLPGDMWRIGHSFNHFRKYRPFSRQFFKRDQEMDRLLQTIIQAAPYGITVIDQNKNVRLWSQAAEEIFGWKAEEVTGKPLPFILEDHLVVTNQKLEEELNGVSRNGIEAIYVRKDGSIIDVMLSTAPLRESSGKIIGSMAIYEDNTARKHIERELRENEQKYRRLFSQMTSGCSLQEMLYDNNGNPVDYITLDANAAYLEILNTKSEDVIGKKASEVLPPEELKKWLGIFNPAASEGRSFHYEIFSPHNGKFFTGVAFGTEKGKFADTFSDITEQKHAADEAHRQIEYSNALASLISRLSTSFDIDKVLSITCEELSIVLNLNACSIFLYDEQKRTLSPECNKGIPAGLWAKFPRLQIKTGKFAEIPEQYLLPNINGRSGIVGLGFTVMVYQNQLIGAIGIPITVPPRDFQPEERLLVQSFARQAAVAVINLRLNNEARVRARELEDLANVSSSLRQARSLPEMIPLLTEQTMQVMHADIGNFFFFSEERTSQKTILVSSQFGTEWQNILSRVDLKTLSDEDQAYFFPGMDETHGQTNPIPSQSSQPFSAFALSIVKSVESLIGILCVGYRNAHSFQEDEKRLLVAIAEMAGNAIHRTNIMDTLEQRVQVRTRELEALYDITRLTSGSIDLDTILGQSLDRVLDIYHVQSGMIQLLSSDGSELQLAAHRGLSPVGVREIRKIGSSGSFAGSVVREKQSILSLDLSKDQLEHLFSLEIPPDVYLGAPIRSKGEVLGVVSIYSNAVHRFSVEEIALLETIANQIGVAVENVRLRQQSQQAAILDERQRLARDLHDSVTQSLFSLNLLAEGYRRHASQASSEQIDAWFEELGLSAHQALKDMRLMLYELRPSTIQQDGLVTAIRHRLDAVETRSNVRVDLIVKGNPALLNKVEEQELYYIAQEALNNTLKHAFALKVEFRLAVYPKSIKMEILDNGIGFDVKNVQVGGMGLANMAERARKLSGKLTIQSQANLYTRVVFSKRADL